MPVLFFFLLNNVASRAHVVLICLAAAISTMSKSGYFVNILDIAPQYAGFIMGLTNSAGILLGVFAPYSAGAMASAPSGSHVWVPIETLILVEGLYVVDVAASVEKRLLSCC